MKTFLIILLILWLLRTRPGFCGLVTVLWSYGRDGAALLNFEFVEGGAYDEYHPGYLYAGMHQYHRNSTAAFGWFTPGGWCILGILISSLGTQYGIIILNRFWGLFLYDEYYLAADRRWLPPWRIK